MGFEAQGRLQVGPTKVQVFEAKNFKEIFGWCCWGYQEMMIEGCGIILLVCS